jgi:hypothetical protein
MSAAFVCPSCKTAARYGLQTRANGSKFWACNGVRHGDGMAGMSCTWTCEEHQGLEFGLVTVKEAIMQVALVASQVGTTLGVRALDQPPNLRHTLADAAEDFEKLGDKLRVVASYLLHREQQAERDARKAGAT